MSIKPIMEYFEMHPEKIKDNVDLKDWEHVRDGRKFLDSHLTTIMLQGDHPRYAVYQDRLLQYWGACACDCDDLRYSPRTNGDKYRARWSTKIY